MKYNLNRYDMVQYSKVPIKERIQVQCYGSAKLTTLNSDGVLHQKKPY